jgi:hypothetical protein
VRKMKFALTSAQIPPESQLPKHEVYGGYTPPESRVTIYGKNYPFYRIAYQADDKP